MTDDIFLLLFLMFVYLTGLTHGIMLHRKLKEKENETK